LTGRPGTTTEADVLVLGAGLVGAAVAHALADRGRRVALLGTPEDAGVPGLGHVSVGPGLPYCTAVEGFGREGARQVWECQRENADRARLFVDGLPGGCDYRRAGGFLLAADRDEGIRLAESEDLLREDGFSGEFLDHYMLESRFDVTGFAGAYWAADDAELDPARLLVALIGSATALGASVRPAGPPLAIRREEGLVVAETPGSLTRAPWGVVTGEAGLGAMGSALAAHVRSAPVQGMTLGTAPGAVLPSPARTVDGRAAWHWQARDHRLVLAGIGTSPAGLLAMADRLVRRPRSETAWAGLAGGSPDGLPVIGVLEDAPVAVAVGLGTLGASYAFVAARWIAEAIVSGRDPTPQRFRPGRFPSG
jgi:glycine/D-amino acid oxidase-like deaminating enzyme